MKLLQAIIRVQSLFACLFNQGSLASHLSAQLAQQTADIHADYGLCLIRSVQFILLFLFIMWEVVFEMETFQIMYFNANPQTYDTVLFCFNYYQYKILHQSYSLFLMSAFNQSSLFFNTYIFHLFFQSLSLQACSTVLSLLVTGHRRCVKFGRPQDWGFSGLFYLTFLDISGALFCMI